MTFTYILFIILYRTCKGTFKFLWNRDKTFAVVFLYEIFNKNIDMDDNRWISWYQSFCKILFLQPVKTPRLTRLNLGNMNLCCRSNTLRSLSFLLGSIKQVNQLQRFRLLCAGHKAKIGQMS